MVENLRTSIFFLYDSLVRRIVYFKKVSLQILSLLSLWLLRVMEYSFFIPVP